MMNAFCSPSILFSQKQFPCINGTPKGLWVPLLLGHMVRDLPPIPGSKKSSIFESHTARYVGRTLLVLTPQVVRYRKKNRVEALNPSKKVFFLVYGIPSTVKSSWLRNMVYTFSDDGMVIFTKPFPLVHVAFFHLSCR